LRTTREERREQKGDPEKNVLFCTAFSPSHDRSLVKSKMFYKILKFQRLKIRAKEMVIKISMVFIQYLNSKANLGKTSYIKTQFRK
jgi:hypothetical protein